MKDLKRKNDDDCQNVPSKVLRRETRAAGKETIKIDEMEDLKRKNDDDCKNVPSKVLRRKTRAAGKETIKIDEMKDLKRKNDDDCQNVPSKVLRRKTRAAGKETMKIDEMKDLKRKNDEDCQNVPSKILRRSDRIKSLGAQRSKTDDQFPSSRNDIIEKEEKGIDRCSNDNEKKDENTDKDENLGIVKTKDNENSEDENMCTVNVEDKNETSIEHESEISGIGKANWVDHLTEVEKTEKTDDTSLDEATVNKVQISENTQEDANSTAESIKDEKECTTNVLCSEDTSTIIYERKKEEQRSERCVFRLLRESESDTSDLVAKNPGSIAVSVEDHVRNGSKGGSSRYISTCKTYNAVRKLVGLKRRGDTSTIRIVRINLDEVRSNIIDLTDSGRRETYMNDHRARGYASNFEEVLIIDRIPSSAYKVIYRGSKNDCPWSEP